MVSVDVKHHVYLLFNKKKFFYENVAQTSILLAVEAPVARGYGYGEGGGGGRVAKGGVEGG